MSFLKLIMHSYVSSDLHQKYLTIRRRHIHGGDLVYYYSHNSLKIDDLLLERYNYLGFNEGRN
jgi:hypothetical protein